MQRKNFIHQLFDEEANNEAQASRSKNINKFIECFNASGSTNRTRQIRILQIGNSGVVSTSKKPFLITQPIKKQPVLFNNEIFRQPHPLPHSAPKETWMHVEATKTGFIVDSLTQSHSKTISPEKYAYLAATQYVALNSSPKRTRGWITRKKKVEELPKQFYRKSSQNGVLAADTQIQIDQNFSKSVNLLNKIKIAQQYVFNANGHQAKNGVVIHHKPKSKGEGSRKTPQDIAEQERRNKLQIKRQISQDYAKPFNPPANITAASYIIFEPKFSENKGRRKKYFLDVEGDIQLADKPSKKYPHSHKVVASFNSRNAVEIASLTKIMTCIIAIEICQKYKLDSKQQTILIGKFESNIGGTSAQICEGETYTLEDLLYGLMLPSGNDASVAIAVWGGRVLISREQSQSATNHKKKELYQRFITEMNQKAKLLSMHKTNYANSHGLCNIQNKSCAFDLALLCEQAMENPKFREIVSCKLYRNTITYYDNAGSKKNMVQEVAKDKEKDDEIQEGEEKDLDSNEEQNEATMPESTICERVVEWENTHRLVQQKGSQYIGIKTGITTAAGPCLASCVKAQNGRTFIIIVLNCGKLSMRFKDTENLKKWIYQREGMTSPRKRPDQEGYGSAAQNSMSPPLTPVK